MTTAEDVLEAEREAKKEAEQAVLDEEMRKRRERVRLWQEEKAKKLTAEVGGVLNDVSGATSSGVDSQLPTDEPVRTEDQMDVTEGVGEAGWSLEDEDDDKELDDNQGDADDDDTAMGRDDGPLGPPPLPRKPDDDESVVSLTPSRATLRSLGLGLGAGEEAEVDYMAITTYDDDNDTYNGYNTGYSGGIGSYTAGPAGGMAGTTGTSGTSGSSNRSGGSGNNSGSSSSGNGAVNPHGSNFITLDQIMGIMGSSRGGGRQDNGWESDVSSVGRAAEGFPAARKKVKLPGQSGSGGSSGSSGGGGLLGGPDREGGRGDADGEGGSGWEEGGESEGEREAREDRERVEFVEAIRAARVAEEAARGGAVGDGGGGWQWRRWWWWRW